MLSGLNQNGVREHPEAATISSGPAHRDCGAISASPCRRVGTRARASRPPSRRCTTRSRRSPTSSQGRHAARSARADAIDVRADRRADRAVHVHVRARGAPRRAWAWIVGGLSAALAPLLGFTSGGVTPTRCCSRSRAALFYCLARAFRRGLELQRGARDRRADRDRLPDEAQLRGAGARAALGLVVLALRGRAASRALGGAYARSGRRRARRRSP